MTFNWKRSSAECLTVEINLKFYLNVVRVSVCKLTDNVRFYICAFTYVSNGVIKLFCFLDAAGTPSDKVEDLGIGLFYITFISSFYTASAGAYKTIFSLGKKLGGCKLGISVFLCIFCTVLHYYLTNIPTGTKSVRGPNIILTELLFCHDWK